MARAAMTKFVAVRVEDELAALLNAMSNKSEFIRSAILAQRAMMCPLCGGRGSVPSAIGTLFTPVARRRCDGADVRPESGVPAPTDEARTSNPVA